jgi:polar amino acid transport system substrate-binding protein
LEEFQEEKMKRFVLTVLVILVMTSVVFAGGKKESGGMTIEKGVLNIGMEIGYPPMEYYGDDGKTPIGFDVDMGKAIAEKMGLKAKFVDTAWDGIFAGVDTGKYDCIMSSVTINDARLAAHNFSKPYVANTLAMVVLKNGKIAAKSPEQCAGLNVAYQAETTADSYMEELANKGLNFSPREYDKVMYCFDELKLGRVDVIVTDLLVAYDYIAPANSPFEIVWKSPDPEKFGICMKKGANELTAAINKALDELFADGTMLKISQKIFGMDLVSEARQ